MKDTLLTVIKSKNYKLDEMLEKISKFYAWGELTADEADELRQAAKDNADVDKELPGTEERIADLENRVAVLEAKFDAAKTWKKWQKPVSRDAFAQYGEGYAYDADGDGADEHYLYIDKTIRDPYHPMMYPARWYKVEDMTLTVDQALSEYEKNTAEA